MEAQAELAESEWSRRSGISRTTDTICARLVRFADFGISSGFGISVCLSFTIPAWRLYTPNSISWFVDFEGLWIVSVDFVGNS